jgi:hypothetical protein
VAIRAAATGVTLEHVEITVGSESDDRGILGLDPDIPAGALSMRVAANVRARGLDAAATDALVRWAVDHCPVLDTVRRAAPIELMTADSLDRERRRRKPGDCVHRRPSALRQPVVNAMKDSRCRGVPSASWSYERTQVDRSLLWWR